MEKTTNMHVILHTAQMFPIAPSAKRGSSVPQWYFYTYQHRKGKFGLKNHNLLFLTPSVYPKVTLSIKVLHTHTYTHHTAPVIFFGVTDIPIYAKMGRNEYDNFIENISGKIQNM